MEDGGTITDGTASVILPEGVSLAKTMTPQSEQVSYGTIKKGDYVPKSWIVKASKSGLYELKVRFEGTDKITRGILKI
ncbi:MAG: hypothetical protein E7294_06545 [Lachnospiraceae bacterium]|nr:hypothetical protein [Lachnospiraceae bacterium]